MLVIHGKLTRLLTFFVWCVLTASAPAWAQSWSNGYSYSRVITIDHTKVPNSDQVNFPFLFSGTYSYLAATSNGGNVTNANGYDIIFTSDAAGKSPLVFERESYSASTGAVSFWVRIPTLLHSSDTVIYMFYDNWSVTTDQSSKTGVWDSNYQGVWHMADNAANTAVSDSTSNGITGINAAFTSAKATTGKMAGALGYNGSTDYTRLTYNSNLNPSQMTVEGWAYVTGGSGTYRALVSSRDGSNASNVKGYVIYADSNDNWAFWTGAGISWWTILNSGMPVVLNTWTHVVATYNGANSTIYINGVGRAGTAHPLVVNTMYETRLGAGRNENSTPQYYFTGNLEEVRISNIARSADWIATEYNNQSNPSTFCSVSSTPPNGPAFTPGQPTTVAAPPPAVTVQPAIALANAAAPQVTPTYDGSGQVVEPSIRYFATAWNGYRYWMVVQPYPNSDDSKENPSVLVSNDGASWAVPPGLVNPIDLPAFPPSTGHFDDGDLFYDAVSNQLWVYYIWEDYNGHLPVSHVLRKTSIDGVHWSRSEDMFQVPGVAVLSPTVEKIGTSYYMWSVNGGTVGCNSASTTTEYRISQDGVNWSQSQLVNISQPGRVTWHVEVESVPSKQEYWMLAADYPIGQQCGATDLFYAKSMDGINWTTYLPMALGTGLLWDHGEIYRSTFTYDPVHDLLRVWYSARGGALGNEWHLGYTEGNYTGLLRHWQQK